LTNSFLNTLARAEREALATAESMRDDLISLRESLPELEIDAEEAALAPDDIESSWKKGEEVPLMKYLEAQAAAVRANARHQFAISRLAQLENRTPLVERVVADSLVPVIERALPGVQVLSTFATVDSMPAKRDLPVASIHQRTPSEQREDGTLAGELTLMYYRSPIHRQLDAEDIDKALATAGMHATVSQVASVADNADELRIKVKHGYSQAPTSLPWTI